jgi:hypothetical protein
VTWPPRRRIGSDVEERHRQERAVLRAELVDLDDRLDLGHRVPMGLADTLGHTGGPGRVHDQRVVIVPARHHLVRRLLADQRPAEAAVLAGGEQRDLLLPVEEALQPGRVCGAGDDVRGAGVDDRMPQRRVGEQVVERHGHATGLPDAEQPRHVLQGVG